MSSREMRAQIVDLLQQNSRNHPDSYPIYITAAIVGWHFRDNPDGMASVDQFNICNVVHVYIAALERDYETEEIRAAHNLVHELSYLIVEKLKANGTISADDDGFTDDDELLAAHEDDFKFWTKELKSTDEESK